MVRSSPIARLVRYSMQGAALTAVVTGLVVLFTSDPETFYGLRNVSLLHLAVLFLLLSGMWVFNAARTCVLARAMGYRVGYAASLSISMSTDFAVTATPGGLGAQPVRLGLLSREGVPAAVAGSIIATDVFLDWAFFVMLIPFAVRIILTDPCWMGILSLINIGSLITAGLSLVGLVGLLYLAARIGGVRIGLRLFGKTRFGKKHRVRGRWRYMSKELRSQVKKSWESVKLLFGRKKLAVLADFVLACLQWSCRYSILPFLLHTFSSTQSPIPLFVLQGLLFSISLMFVLPGGGGSVEILSLFILPNFVPRSLVGVVLLLWRFFTYYMCLLAGGIVFVCKIRNLGKSGGDLVENIASASPHGAGGERVRIHR